MQSDSHGDGLQFMLRDSQFLRDFGLIDSHALRVCRCFTVTKIDGCTQSLERVLITALDFPKRCFKLPCPLFDHFLEALTVVLHLLLQALFFNARSRLAMTFSICKGLTSYSSAHLFI